MKKGVAIIVTFCYLLMTTGVIAVSHYCMDRLASVSFFASNTKKCGKCGMAKDAHNCCNDKETFVKVSQDHNPTFAFVYDLPVKDKLQVAVTDFLLTQLQNGNQYLYNKIHPPPLPDEDIYLANSVFRI